MWLKIRTNFTFFLFVFSLFEVCPNKKCAWAVRLAYFTSGKSGYVGDVGNLARAGGDDEGRAVLLLDAFRSGGQKTQRDPYPAETNITQKEYYTSDHIGQMLLFHD